MSEPAAQAIRLYALREVTPTRIPGFIVREPATGRLVSNMSLSTGYLIDPATFEVDAALAAAHELHVELGCAWALIPAHSPCPVCGQAVAANSLDFIYQTATEWVADCFRRAGRGCGHQAHGASKQDALFRWGSPHALS